MSRQGKKEPGWAGDGVEDEGGWAQEAGQGAGRRIPRMRAHPQCRALLVCSPGLGGETATVGVGAGVFAGTARPRPHQLTISSRLNLLLALQ